MKGRNLQMPISKIPTVVPGSVIDLLARLAVLILLNLFLATV